MLNQLAHDIRYAGRLLITSPTFAAVAVLTLALGIGANASPGLPFTGSFAVGRLLTTMLFGVGSGDPRIFAWMALLLAVISALACVIPARRATRVDPMVALRAE